MADWNEGKAKLKGWLRRQREAKLPDRQTRAYRAWMKRHLKERDERRKATVPPGLLSIITAVWDGSPVSYLSQLARSIELQNPRGAAEWVLLDNGCRKPALKQALDALRLSPFVRIITHAENVGIARGLRLCLEAAKGRYVLPVDADDLLYPDALAIVAEAILQSGGPKLLYSDEDKINAGRISQAYFKPDWDPVLLSNSAYIAHLGIVDRLTALELGAYVESSVESSVDWDLFLRFASAGYEAVHIREVLYQWRIHAQSTADDGRAKSVVGASQRAALQAYLRRRGFQQRFEVVESGLLPGGQHHRLRAAAKPSYDSMSQLTWRSDELVTDLLSRAGATNADFICLLQEEITSEDVAEREQALALFELFSDTAMVGGRVFDPAGRVWDAGRQFGFSGCCGCPDRGRAASDAGYFGQALKTRSVDAAGSSLLLARTSFLLVALRSLLPSLKVADAGPWLGALAQREGLRVVYTPYWSARLTALPVPETGGDLRGHFPELFSSRRYYPPPLSLVHAYLPND